MTAKQKLIKRATEWSACAEGIDYLTSLPDDVTMRDVIADCPIDHLDWWLESIAYHHDLRGGALDEWDRVYGDITRQRIIEGHSGWQYVLYVTELPVDVLKTMSDILSDADINQLEWYRYDLYGETICLSELLENN